MDHIELARARDRMCKACSEDCRPCPLSALSDSCNRCNTIEDDCRLACMTSPEETVKIISEWVSENPAPRYPTWREWLTSILPDVPSAMKIQFFDADQNADFKIEIIGDRVNSAASDRNTRIVTSSHGSLDSRINAQFARVLGVKKIKEEVKQGAEV